MYDPRFLPICKEDLDELGWDYVDVIIISADAYVDHPCFGHAVVGRLLEHEGLRVAILPQPNWRDDLRDFKKLGKPRLFFAISSGMDSMVNHYTAASPQRRRLYAGEQGRIPPRLCDLHLRKNFEEALPRCAAAHWRA